MTMARLLVLAAAAPWCLECNKFRTAESLQVEANATSPEVEEADFEASLVSFYKIEHHQRLERMRDALLDPKLRHFVALPVACTLAGGLVRLGALGFGVVGDFLLYFGMQTTMSFYMKYILSKSIVSRESTLIGLPAPLAVTGLQQLVSCTLLMFCLGCLRFTPWSYKPKPIENHRQRLMVLGLATCFASNIGLNNLSLTYLDVSVNIAVRSTTPMVGMLVDAALKPVISRLTGRANPLEVPRVAEALLVLMGTLCSVAVVYSKGSGGITSHNAFGIFICVLSVFTSYVELLFVKFMSTEIKLNPVDAVCHMALPVAAILTPFVFIFSHAVPWPGNPYMTDYQVLVKVITLNPWTFVLALGSGVLALAFNLIFYNVVQKFSPVTACIASNFNKVAMVALSLILGLEPMPAHYWKYVLILATVGNGITFAFLGMAKSKAPAAAQKHEVEKAFAAPGAEKHERPFASLGLPIRTTQR
eukprot:TRINITY_DN13311_c0_g1_i1.p1 TRINITY_DN13311_c0_g1~~TRINITY_DN13311_c0_g1_i1.p1  ORF type:complete len:475 (-),score=71.17 TRINITY_DN13311_c0_g1_i1:91-1515(-)